MYGNLAATCLWLLDGSLLSDHRLKGSVEFYLYRVMLTDFISPLSLLLSEATAAGGQNGNTYKNQIISYAYFDICFNHFI